MYHSSDVYHYVDGLDVSKSNWMRFVNPAHSEGHQNLVACQIGLEIYFYTVRPVPADRELLVWYSRQFAERLHSPATGHAMMQRISKYSHLVVIWVVTW